MDTSKIVVDALEFQAAMKAVLAVAPKAEPNDLVQFRVVSDSLIIGARTQREVIGVDVYTEYVDMNYERDTAFEITRNEAVALSAMRMKKEEDEDQVLLGLLVHEKYIIRTDESGFGLGLRSVKVKRHGNYYDPYLGDLPQVLNTARRATPTTQAPMLEPKQVGMVAAAFRAWDTPPVFWTAAADEFSVRNVVTARGITMIVMSSPFRDKPGSVMPEEYSKPRSGEQGFDDVPLDFTVESAEAEGKTSKNLKTVTITAKPPGGIA